MEANATSRVIPPRDPAWVDTLRSLWQWTQRTVKVRRIRRLRVCETLSLGERRFLAVIEFDHQEFLVGGTGSSLELLARLHDGTVVTEPSLARGGLPL
jgi:flagellar biogenesis protein FliO